MESPRVPHTFSSRCSRRKCGTISAQSADQSPKHPSPPEKKGAKWRNLRSPCEPSAPHGEQATYTQAVNFRALCRIIGTSVLTAGATFVITSLISCVALTCQAGRQYPHDGQNGLYGFLIGGLIGLGFAIPTFLGALIWRIIQFASTDEG